jgi:hypothetical protein
MTPVLQIGLMTPEAILTRILPAVPDLLPRAATPSNRAYLRSYREFVRHAQALKPIDEGAVILVAGLVYSWMPRTLRLGGPTDLAAAAEILESARRRTNLTARAFEGLSTALGGSPVAASKALHFFHPELYAIWDSRVWRALDWHSSEVRANAGARYVSYADLVSSAGELAEFVPIHTLVEQTVGYPVSRIRALELLLFLSGEIEHEE